MQQPKILRRQFVKKLRTKKKKDSRCDLKHDHINNCKTSPPSSYIPMAIFFSLAHLRLNEFNFHITFNWFAINFHIFLSPSRRDFSVCAAFISLFVPLMFSPNFFFNATRYFLALLCEAAKGARKKKHKHLFRLPFLPPS